MSENRTEKLLPVYLALGEDELKRKAAIQRIKAYVEPAYQAFNLSEFDARTLPEFTALSDALEQIPFSDERRVVIVYYADKFSKDSCDALLNYLLKPNPTTILLLSAEKLAKNSPLRKEVAKFGKTAVIDCEIPKGYAFTEYIREIAQNRYGIVLETAALRALIDSYGQENMSLLENGLSMLAQTGKKRLGVLDVKSVLPKLQSPKPWLLADALANRDYSQALSLFSCRSNGEEPLLFWYIVNKLRELICARALINEGNPQKLSELLGGPSWKYKNHITQAKLFSSTHLSRCLQRATTVEKAMKGSSDTSIAFELWFDYICNNND